MLSAVLGRTLQQLVDGFIIEVNLARLETPRAHGIPKRSPSLLALVRVIQNGQSAEIPLAELRSVAWQVAPRVTLQLRRLKSGCCDLWPEAHIHMPSPSCVTFLLHVLSKSHSFIAFTRNQSYCSLSWSECCVLPPASCWAGPRKSEAVRLPSCEGMPCSKEAGPSASSSS